MVSIAAFQKNKNFITSGNWLTLRYAFITGLIGKLLRHSKILFYIEQRVTINHISTKSLVLAPFFPSTYSRMNIWHRHNLRCFRPSMKRVPSALQSSMFVALFILLSASPYTQRCTFVNGRFDRWSALLYWKNITSFFPSKRIGSDLGLVNIKFWPKELQ